MRSLAGNLTLRLLRLSCVLAFLASSTAFALDPNRSLTQYVHRIWQMQQGLPQSTILSIAQSADGYLWLGTQGGLVRFDGVRFTLPLENSWVRNLLEDQQHNLWLGTNDAGLMRFTKGELTRYPALQTNVVRCVVPGADGELWICTPNGLAQFRDAKFTVHQTAQGLSTNNLRAACRTPDGRIWAGGDSRELNVWDGSRFSRVPLNSMPLFATVRALLSAGDGSIWIGTSNGLIRLKNGKQRRFTEADGLADDAILSLAEGREGALWIGTNDGFSRFRNGEFESFRTKDGLSQSAVYSVYEDREGSLWVGTKHGLNQFLDGRTIPFTISEGLPSNDAGPVFQDRYGHTWAGTLGGGLGLYDGHRFTVLTRQQGLASNTIYALAEDAEGDLWAGTDAGVDRLHQGHFSATYTTRQGLPANVVQVLFRDRRGVLWAGTPSGAAVFRDGRFVRVDGPKAAPVGQVPDLPSGPPGQVGDLPHWRVPILCFGEDGAGRLYAATGSGLLVYKDEAFVDFCPPSNPACLGTQTGLPAPQVDALFQDRGGLLWLGTVGGGLRLLKDGKIFTYWMRNGLFDDEIFGIASDGQDRLWMACSKGIFSANRSDLLSFAAGRIAKFVSTPYSPMDALRTIECKSGVQPAVWRMRDGRLWFSTIRGLIVLDPGILERKSQPPPVVIEDVTVNGHAEAPGKIGDLPPSLKNLNFRYTGLSFRQPTRTTFRYILQGFDKKWIDAGARREALYTNLPPGKYTFQVTACNSDGACNETGSSMAFVLAPHYYQRAWFLAMCAASLALSIWLAYQLRIRGLKKHFDIVLTERGRIARELHDTLIQGFSGVTMELQALSARLASPQESRTLGEIIEDAAECLREARRSVAGLRNPSDPNSGLAAAIAQAAKQITEAKDIRLRLKLQSNPQGLPADVEYNLLRIAQEAVSNSVKHSGARTVEVSLAATPDSVRLAVADDGSGFAGQDGGPGHYGLIGMRERAKNIGADFELESEPGRGTRICVLLPYTK